MALSHAAARRVAAVVCVGAEIRSGIQGQLKRVGTGIDSTGAQISDQTSEPRRECRCHRRGHNQAIMGCNQLTRMGRNQLETCATILTGCATILLTIRHTAPRDALYCVCAVCAARACAPRQQASRRMKRNRMMMTRPLSHHRAPATRRRVQAIASATYRRRNAYLQWACVGVGVGAGVSVDGCAPAAAHTVAHARPPAA